MLINRGGIVNKKELEKLISTLKIVIEKKIRKEFH